MMACTENCCSTLNNGLGEAHKFGTQLVTGTDTESAANRSRHSVLGSLRRHTPSKCRLSNDDLIKLPSLRDANSAASADTSDDECAADGRV